MLVRGEKNKFRFSIIKKYEGQELISERRELTAYADIASFEPPN
jgi:hypothetical protein